MRRRDLLLSAAALGATAAAPPRRAAPDEKARLFKLFDGFVEDGLRRHPESATELGLDTGPRAGLKARLSDVSQAGLEAERAATAQRLQAMAAIKREALPPASRLHLDSARYRDESAKGVLAFDWVSQDGFAPSPYVVSPITGAYQRTPTFLDTKHRIETAEDAEAYLSRLDAFAVSLDANTARMRAATGQGVIAPDFLLDVTLTQLAALRTAPEASNLALSLDRRARAKGLGEQWGPRAVAACRDRVMPALDRQLEAVRAARAQATHEAGCWRWKGGPEFYAANLKATTTTDMSPDEVHKLGLDEAREIAARLDVLLKAQGLTQGTVGERIRGLYKDPKQFYPNTDAGKVQLVADLQAKLDAVRARLPRVFATLPHNRIEVRRVPPAIESGAPGAYSERPSLDGTRPGYNYFNLADTAEWPRWNLSTTLYHEGLPGHQLQGGIALENRDIPLYVRNLGFSGYGEGWALYAEQLADELGMYEDDPLGRIGWLKGQIFRAGRCVIDTGMHHLRWSREQAIDYLGQLDGDAVGFTTRETHRYCAIPAQACSYKIGHTVWLRLRERAKAQLGPRFDIRGFHDAGLRNGSMPLDVLDHAIADWTRSVKA